MKCIEFAEHTGLQIPDLKVQIALSVRGTSVCEILSISGGTGAGEAEALLQAFGLSVGSCGHANVLTTVRWLNLLYRILPLVLLVLKRSQLLLPVCLVDNPIL